MADEREVLSKIESGSSSYYLFTTLKNRGEDGFSVTLSNGELAWKTSVSSEDVKSMASNVDMELDEYINQSARALTGQSSGVESFVYQTTEQGNDIKFSWKKQLGDGVKFQLGSLTLVLEDGPSTVNQVFAFAVREMANLKEEILTLRSENGRLSNERKNAMKLLEKCVSTKEEMETDLYHKFAAVLNAKKAKIRQLKSEVHELEQSAMDATDNIATQETTATTSHRRQMSTSSEENSTVSPISPSSPQQESSIAVLGNSPSLLLEEDSEPIQPTAKRRRRREPKVTGTPTRKVVLPKVSSIKKTPSTSSEDSITTPRLRKKLSEKSDVDADDLMAEMGL